MDGAPFVMAAAPSSRSWLFPSGSWSVCKQLRSAHQTLPTISCWCRVFCDTGCQADFSFSTDRAGGHVPGAGVQHSWSRGGVRNAQWQRCPPGLSTHVEVCPPAAPSALLLGHGQSCARSAVEGAEPPALLGLRVSGFCPAGTGRGSLESCPCVSSGVRGSAGEACSSPPRSLLRGCR